MNDTELCRQYGFEVGARDPEVNPEYPGRYMVTDRNGWAIVGDDLAALTAETVMTWELENAL